MGVPNSHRLKYQNLELKISKKLSKRQQEILTTHQQELRYRKPTQHPSGFEGSWLRILWLEVGDTFTMARISYSITRSKQQNPTYCTYLYCLLRYCFHAITTEGVGSYFIERREIRVENMEEVRKKQHIS